MGSDGGGGNAAPFFMISIHAPRMGSDLKRECVDVPWVKFQSTLPVWGATNPDATSRWRGGISIHAPRMGSDERRGMATSSTDRFQSTLPVWGATSMWFACKPSPRFQSTLPVWGATRTKLPYRANVLISIHAPRMGSDSARRWRRKRCSNFNPRSPYGERPSRIGTEERGCSISIHAPRMGSDEAARVRAAARLAFQSTLPVWGATPSGRVCTNSSPAYCMRPISSRLRKAESAGNMFKNWCEATQQYVRSSPSHPTNKLQG